MYSIALVKPLPASQPATQPSTEGFTMPPVGGEAGAPAISPGPLAFVPSERPTPNLFQGVLQLLQWGVQGIGRLAGFAVGTGAQLLEQLLSNPTADTRELVRMIRNLEAQGLDIDSAIALRQLPNGDLGVYAVHDPDNPFPELLAVIKQDGSIVLPAQDERPDTTGPTRPLILSDFDASLGVPAQGSPSSNAEQSSGAEQERPPSGEGNSFEDTSFPPPQLSFPEVPPTDPNRLSPEAQARIDALNAQRQEIKERDAKFQDQSDRLDDEIGQMEAEQRRLAEQGRLRLGAQNTLRDLERAISGGVDTMIGAALSNPQHIEALVGAVAGKVDRLRAEGEDEKALALIEAFLERYPDFNSDLDGAGALPGSHQVAGMSSGPAGVASLEQAERIAREAIERSLGNSSFVTGESPIQKAIEENGPLVELFLHALWPQFAPGTLGGAPSGRPGISTATINALRNLDPQAAADLVNEQLADTLANVPPNYRDAILESLQRGDPQDANVAQAAARIEALRPADPADGVAPPPVVTNFADAIRLLQDRFGMYVSNDLHSAGSDRTYHFEETFLEVVNNAIPIFDDIERRFPGALEGIGLALKTPNTRDAEDSGFITVGVSSEQTGVMALMAPSQIAKYEIMQDPDTVFRGTVAHEAMHAMVAKADPMLVQRFRDNLEPVAMVHGPNNDNPAPGSMSRQDIIDEMYFPGATWQEFLQWANHEGYIIQPTTQEILGSLQELGYAPYFTPRFEGDVMIFRDPEEPACEVLGLCVSRYAGNPYEGLPEMFAAMTLGATEANVLDEGLPHNTIGFDPSNPPPRNLREHLDAIMASVMHGQSPDSYHLPSPIRVEDHDVEE